MAAVSDWAITVFLNFLLGAAASFSNIEPISEFPAISQCQLLVVYKYSKPKSVKRHILAE